MKNKSVVILDCNHNLDVPHIVFIEMTTRLAQRGINLIVDKHWSDEYITSDLIIGADPLVDNENLLDCRILGQRTLNRRTRLDFADQFGALIAPYGSPLDDIELTTLATGWGVNCAVLKYDWSARRTGVFFWPLDSDRRKPFPNDFNSTCDIFMAFQDGDPQTYKVDAFGGVLLGAYILPTPDMREPEWQQISQREHVSFDPPQHVKKQICEISQNLLNEGAGYTSFDLMCCKGEFRIIEMNTCGVGTGRWNEEPEKYARNYSDAIVETLGQIEAIPRYKNLQDRALSQGNND